MTDDQIKQITIAHFVAQGDTPDEWGVHSLNMQWFRSVGLPFARAILSEALDKTKADRRIYDSIAENYRRSTAGVPGTPTDQQEKPRVLASDPVQPGVCLPHGVMFDAFGDPRTRYVRVSYDGAHMVLDPAEVDSFKADAAASAASVGMTDPHTYTDVYLSEREFDELPEFDGF